MYNSFYSHTLRLSIAEYCTAHCTLCTVHMKKHNRVQRLIYFVLRLIYFDLRQLGILSENVFVSCLAILTFSVQLEEKSYCPKFRGVISIFSPFPPVHPLFFAAGLSVKKMERDLWNNLLLLLFPSHTLEQSIVPLFAQHYIEYKGVEKYVKYQNNRKQNIFSQVNNLCNVYKIITRNRVYIQVKRFGMYYRGSDF